MITVKITCDSGDTWATRINATIKEAQTYFMGHPFVVSETEEGVEIKATVVNVEEVPE